MILSLIVVILAVCFGGVLLVGAPYLPTLQPQVEAALKLADMKPGDRIIELGCGDGKVLVAAARAGYHATGYELNPILAVIAWARTRRYGSRVHVVCGDFWRAEWPEAEAIFTFLLPRFMKKLDKKVIQYKHKPVKLVSFAFMVPGREADENRQGVLLYRYR
jgi:SAM-dependent methyltransferase